jgi:hypothetical protein
MANMGPLETENTTEPMRILQECIDVLRKKGSDYQNPKSTIVQADYYESGVKTIMEIIQAKRLRLKSLIETIEHDPNASPNFESIEDSFKDMANYCAIGAAWCRGKINGQDPEKDILNRKRQIVMMFSETGPKYANGTPVVNSSPRTF